MTAFFSAKRRLASRDELRPGERKAVRRALAIALVSLCLSVGGACYLAATTALPTLQAVLGPAGLAEGRAQCPSGNFFMESVELREKQALLF